MEEQPDNVAKRHNKRESIGNAASLFGEADSPAADFFASTGDNVSYQNGTQHHSVDTAASLFGPADAQNHYDDKFTVLDSSGYGQPQTNGSVEYPLAPTGYITNDGPHRDYEQYGSGNQSYDYDGYYDRNGQWKINQQEYDAPNAVAADSYGAQQSAPLGDNNYNGYTPYGNQSDDPHTNWDYSSFNGSHVNPYSPTYSNAPQAPSNNSTLHAKESYLSEPYAPYSVPSYPQPASNVYNPYAPPPNPSAIPNSAYHSPEATAAPAAYTQPAAPGPPLVSAYSTTSTAFVPAPLAQATSVSTASTSTSSPDVSQYRSSSFNAYDPPVLPAIRKSSRANSNLLPPPPARASPSPLNALQEAPPPLSSPFASSPPRTSTRTPATQLPLPPPSKIWRNVSTPPPSRGPIIRPPPRTAAATRPTPASPVIDGTHHVAQSYEPLDHSQSTTTGSSNASEITANNSEQPDAILDDRPSRGDDLVPPAPHDVSLVSAFPGPHGLSPAVEVTEVEEVRSVRITASKADDLDESAEPQIRAGPIVNYVVPYPPVDLTPPPSRASPVPFASNAPALRNSIDELFIDDAEMLGDNRESLGEGPLEHDFTSTERSAQEGLHTPQHYDAYAPGGSYGLPATSVPLPMPETPAAPFNPYAPSTHAQGPPQPNHLSPSLQPNGRMSPAPLVPSVHDASPALSPPQHLPHPNSTYGPPQSSAQPVDPYAPATGPYAPAANPLRPLTLPPANAVVPSVNPKIPLGNLLSPAANTTVQSGAYFPPQPFIPAPSTYAPYATSAPSAYIPSPSQTAAEDPRSSARIPIFHFGFGGKLVTCFHSQLDATTGFDVSLTGRRSSPIVIQSLSKVIASSALEPSTTEFPGPLFSGPSSPAMGIVRSTASSGAKSKKASVLKYLTERAEEIERGVGYLSSAKESAAERRVAEDRAVLLKLLAVMVDNDGKLTGSSVIDTQVRSALLSVSSSSVALASSGSPSAPFGFATTIDKASPNENYLPSDIDKGSIIATYHLRATDLDKIQAHLLAGERREACHYALDQKMWAHAMIIASSLDKETWKDVTNEFIRSELGVAPGAGFNASNGRESLRVAYSLFSGQGTASLQELLPPKSLSRSGDSLLPPLAPVPQTTPVSPNFPNPAVAGNISPDVLEKWPETAATIISSSATGEYSTSLTALGDYLISNGWVEAAHACYLLSPQTSPINGLGAPSVRVVLLGSDSPSVRRSLPVDFESIRLTEVVEFALSLAPLSGKEGFSGFAHLQAFKLVRAYQLAEIGNVKDATRYLEAIASTLKSHTRGSVYFTSSFLAAHKQLSDRLTGVPDRNSSWMNLKKPSIDSLGSWSISKFARFIEGDEPPPENEVGTPPAADKLDPIGAFSHYSEISSTTTSQVPSPNGSVKGFSLPNISSTSLPPRRTGSAMASRPPAVNPPIDRAASAIDYLRPSKTSPIGRAYSAHPSTTTFQFAGSRHSLPTGTSTFTPTLQPSSGEDEDQDTGTGNGWWNSTSASSAYIVDSTGATPTASTFQQPDDSAESGNFVSLMDAYSPMPSPAPTMGPVPRRKSELVDDDEEDLGFGNSSHKPKTVPPKAIESAPQPQEQEQLRASEPAPASAKPKGWFSGWWGKKDDDSPAPIRANLGESQNSFYYDKDLKRWVNKKEGSSAPPPSTPPPPPSRAQTASPSVMGGGPSMNRPSPSGATPPPPRSQSASMGGPPPTPPASLRGPSGLSSSFVPSEPGSAPPTRTRTAQGQRKNARSRYVDILNTPSPT